VFRRTSTVVACLLSIMTLPTLTAAQTPQPPPEPVVVVSGEGIVKATPDVAWVTIGAESRSKSPKDAQAQNATAMSGVHEKLTGARIPKDAIRTLSVDVQQEVDWVDGRRVIRGYFARNTIEVRVDDVARVGEILDLSVGTGATSVQGLRFDIKDRTSLERDALRRAVADARARAEAAAAGAGTSIGRVVRIEEPDIMRTPPQPMMYARAAMAEDKAATPVAAGEIEIRARVTLTASIK
jgi:uncharacterized protein